jgi:hypothetical protein
MVNRAVVLNLSVLNACSHVFSFFVILEHKFYVYSLSMPFAGVYYFKLEMEFECPVISFILLKALPQFISNLWEMHVGV